MRVVERERDQGFLFEAMLELHDKTTDKNLQNPRFLLL